MGQICSVRLWLRLKCFLATGPTANSITELLRCFLRSMINFSFHRKKKGGGVIHKQRVYRKTCERRPTTMMQLHTGWQRLLWATQKKKTMSRQLAVHANLPKYRRTKKPVLNKSRQNTSRTKLHNINSSQRKWHAATSWVSWSGIVFWNPVQLITGYGQDKRTTLNEH